MSPRLEGVEEVKVVTYIQSSLKQGQLDVSVKQSAPTAHEEPRRCSDAYRTDLWTNALVQPTRTACLHLLPALPKYPEAEAGKARPAVSPSFPPNTVPPRLAPPSHPHPHHAPLRGPRQLLRMRRLTIRAPIGWRSKHGRGTRWRRYKASRETAPCYLERRVEVAVSGRGCAARSIGTAAELGVGRGQCVPGRGELLAFAMEEDWDTELLEQEAAAASQRHFDEWAWTANSGRPNSPSLHFSSRPSSPLSGFPGRPNSHFFGFSQNKGSLGANEGPNRNLHMQRDIGGYSGSRDSVLCLNREDQPVTGFGRGRSSGSRDFQEGNSANDPGMQEQGFRDIPGIFGQSKCFNSEIRNSPLRGSPFAPGVSGAVGGPAAGVNKGCYEEIVCGRGPKVTYVPPPPPDDEQSIFARYQSGINFDKYDECTVEMSGLDPPTPLLAFEEANFSQSLRKNISKTGYSKLTPVQKYSIPVIQAGRDLMSCAQTGSGKTAAFLLPIVDQMMKDGITASVFQKQQEPQCVIVAPTRELINQIFLEARKFVYG
ncbi:probable ATP-dependent RNA helicase DDX4 [Meleagris gallopavo]|uniref:probable ATP-dependent RNA helicase DDX4 n=1 Tax=Meleagris gallopavo TaxID=9103 RepID=UPI000938EC33|nr:probable ATP-dependent RNA helicase DDX4 [Meleagris gallopavo]